MAQERNRVKALSDLFWSSLWGNTVSANAPNFCLYKHYPSNIPSYSSLRGGRVMVAAFGEGKWGWGRNFSVASFWRSRCLLFPELGSGGGSKIYDHAPAEEETHLTRRLNPSGEIDNIIIEEENRTNLLIIVDSDSGQLIIFLRW